MVERHRSPDVHALPAGARDRVGSSVGKYRLDEVLGLGGAAVVYRATHRNGNRVAVKMLHVELSLQPEMRARFLREGYVANKVDHRGVVRVLDDDATDDGAVFLVMDLLAGETVDARWRRTKLEASVVSQIADQVLDVLTAAHEKAIVHRDIKPENLFLTDEGDVKVLDFGIARFEVSGAKLTREGHPFGTPSFMAPEQALGRNREIDGRSDLWALGSTMFFLLSGQYVHDSESPQETLVLTATRPVPSLATVAPHVPTPLVAVIDKALAFGAEGRWPDARAMQAALRTAHVEAFGEPLAPRLTPAPRVPDSGRGPVGVDASAPTALNFVATAQTLPSGSAAAETQQGPPPSALDGPAHPATVPAGSVVVPRSRRFVGAAAVAMAVAGALGVSWWVTRPAAETRGASRAATAAAADDPIAPAFTPPPAPTASSMPPPALAGPSSAAGSAQSATPRRLNPPAVGARPAPLPSPKRPPRPAFVPDQL